MIKPESIEKVLDAASIVDVVSDFVTLKKAGVNLKGLCPFHNDTTPSFMVSPAKNLCKCFACGEGGSPVVFIMKHENLNYYEAIKFQHTTITKLTNYMLVINRQKVMFKRMVY